MHFDIIKWKKTSPLTLLCLILLSKQHWKGYPKNKNSVFICSTILQSTKEDIYLYNESHPGPKQHCVPQKKVRVGTTR